jgi:telomere length regulation protein
LFLLLLRSFPPQSPPLQRVAASPAFLNGLTHYLSHPDRTIRHLGMLGAEVVSELTVTAGGKKLDFALWDGDEPHKRLARRLRALGVDRMPAMHGVDPTLGWRLADSTGAAPFAAVGARSMSPRRSSLALSADASPPAQRKAKKLKAPPVELSDSDDSLTGYQSSSSVSSTRSASPSPSDLDEYIEDPTLYNAKKKKVPRPVYLAQLGELLSSRDDPDKLEAGLKWGESLVRRKRGFGMELGASTGRHGSAKA